MYTEGWNRQVHVQRQEAKDLKRAINTQWIYPPEPNREAIFGIANPDHVTVPWWCLGSVVARHRISDTEISNFSMVRIFGEVIPMIRASPVHAAEPISIVKRLFQICGARIEITHHCVRKLQRCGTLCGN